MKTTRRLAGFFVTLAFCTSNCSAQTFSTSTASSTITSTTQARSSGTSTNPQITTGPTVATSACSWLSSYISSCISRLPGFLSAPEPTQRSCLCTQSTLIGNYSSALFDAEVSICANYVSTANPSDYGRWSDLVGFCTSPGPIVTSTFSTITSAAPTSSSAAGTTPVTVPTTSATTGINQPGGSGNLGPIQNFTKAQIAGISIGCTGAVAILSLACLACRRQSRRDKLKKINSTGEALPTPREKDNRQISRST